MLVLPLLAGVLAGCAADRPVAEARRGPLLTADGGRQSLALNSPAMQQPARRTGTGLPWYAYRNETPDAVALGLATPTLKSSYTRTVDRLYSIDGEVTDQYSEITYRRRSRRTIH